MAQQHAAFSTAPVGVVRPPRDPLPYVTPELFDEQIHRAHWSYHFAISGVELGTVRFRDPGHYMPPHPGWCLKYVIQHFRIFVSPHLFVIKIYFRFVVQATRSRASSLSALG
jgi:hypothetical protein